MILDQQQRDSALDPTCSFIVQAPAGSGKTELLTQRFLRLLACVNEPEEILAITFTKKAASEMRHRVRDALKKAHQEALPKTLHEQKTWQLAKNALLRDKARNWGLLDNPNRLRIRTIDAFNTQLTKQLPLLSHFGATPEIIDFPKLVYREAVQTFLAHLEENVAWSPAIAQLLLHLDNNIQAAEELLIDMLSRRDQWLPYIISQHNNPALREMLENNLATVVSETLLKLTAEFPADCAAELIALLQYAARELKISNPHSPYVIFENINQLPGNLAEDKAAWLALSHFLITDSDYNWRKKVDKNLGFPPENPSFKQRMLEFIDHCSHREKLHQALIELRSLPEPYYSEQQWEILSALHEVLKMLVAQLHVIFKQTGKIDYPENAQAALTALGNDDAPTDLALVLDYQMQHILVDEFQDTSNNQFRLLEKLIHGWQEGDGRTLFLVGDPMQSIYRFRQAEVGLFIRARQHGIGHITLTPLTLTVNFRSTTAIVDWLNTHFDKVLPAYDDIASGAVSYTPSTAHVKQNDDKQPAVNIHTLTNDDGESQADTLVNIVQNCLQQDSESNIAILVRSRNDLADLIPALKAANIHYQAIDIDPLENRPVIQDLLALTRALLYPADRVAWLSILRAPWCGLTLNDLLLLVGNDRYDIIWQRMQNPELFATLSEDGKQRLQRILPIINTAIAERLRDSIHLWVEKTWLLLGGPACLPKQTDLEDAKIFFNLLKKLSLQDTNGSIKWDALKESMKQLFAQSSHQAEGRLQIMTIHNAKGLEFDTVILPHLERKTGSNDKPLLTWLERPLIDHDTALILAPIHATENEEDSIYRHIRQQDTKKTKHENGRLLYVATTRAKKSLHLLMTLKMNAKGEFANIQESSLLKSLWPAIREHAHASSTTNASYQPKIKQQTVITRLTPTWSNPLKNHLQTERPAHNKIQGFHLANSDAQIIGIVVHYILQQISRLGLAWWQAKTPQQIQQLIQHQLTKNGNLSTTTDNPITVVIRAIQKTLADPRGLWIVSNHQEAQSEWPLTAVLDNKAKMLIIDRTFVDEHNVRWIIDYKTSTPHEQELASFINQEKMKYAEQMQHYRQALTLLQDRPIKLGLYFPLVPAWCEW